MMKRINFLNFILLSCIFLFNACTKNTETDLLEVAEDTPSLRMDIDPQLVPPDLRIVSITSNLPVEDTPCGNNVSNAICGGPGTPQAVSFTVVVENDSPTPIPTGTLIEVDVCLFGGACTGPSIDGLGAFETKTITTVPGFLGCPQGPGPYQFVTETFFARVDMSNLIAESDETNNFSDRFLVCRDSD